MRGLGVSLISLLIPLAAFGVEPVPQKDEVCSLNEAVKLKYVGLNFVPSYFSKVDPNRDIAYIMTGGQNYAVFVDSGKMIQVPCDVDPVPSPDGKILSTVCKYDPRPEESKSVWFYDTVDAVDKPRKDPAQEYGYMAGNYTDGYAYQSMGLKSSEGDKTTYTLLCDRDDGYIYIRDETFTFNGSKSIGFKEGVWHQVCPNLPGLRKLPIISKDGKMLSAYDTKYGKTVIYDLSPDGKCSVKEILPYKTGKADFSFDGRYVAFHVDKVASKAHWFLNANPNSGMTLYVWDLQKHEAKKITDYDTDGNNYFPAFQKNGHIGHFRQYKKGGRVKYEYVITDPKLQSDPPSIDPDPNCKDCVWDYVKRLGLGVLLNNVCDMKKTMVMSEAVLLSQKMDLAKCESLVDKYWNQMPDVIGKVQNMESQVKGTTSTRLSQMLKEVPPDALKAFCPGLKPVEQNTTLVSKSLPPGERLMHDCAKCHSGSKPVGKISFDPQKINSIPFAVRQSMANQIKSGNMPPGGEPPEDRGPLSKFLIEQH